MAITWKEIYRADGTDVAVADGGTGQSTAQAAIDALTSVAGATNEYVLTKDTATGNATFKVATTPEDFYMKRNLQTVDANYTLASGYNGLVVGPITLNDTKTITITDGSRFVVL